MSVASTWALPISFSFLPAVGLHNVFSMVYKFVLSSAIICQQHLSELNQISNNVANSSTLDSCLKAMSLTLSEQRKWPPDIHNSWLSQERKKALENRAVPCMTLWFLLLQTVHHCERKHSPSDLSHSSILPLLLQASAREEDVDDSLIAQWAGIQPLTIHWPLFCLL